MDYFIEYPGVLGIRDKGKFNFTISLDQDSNGGV